MAVVATLLATAGGCVGRAVKYFADTGDRSTGLTVYVGGAGPVGNVGSFDVPAGLQDAGYAGAVEVFAWQGLTHAGDQINLHRNRAKGVELANRLRQYHQRFPKNPIYIIALSAGTGVATFALEYLPESVQIDRAVFLGCSMSSEYDLTRALRRIRERLYVVYSDRDPILANLVRVTGTVDRRPGSEGIAGMRGFVIPAAPGADTERQYQKVENVPWRYDFERTGYHGHHTDSTSRLFITYYLAPALMGNDEKLVGWHLLDPQASSQPVASRPAASRPAHATGGGVDE